MGIKILGLGKTAGAYLPQAETEYLQRLKKYVKVEYQLLPDVRKKIPDPMRLKEAEAEIWMKALRPGNFVVGLDERGDRFSSSEFASWLERQLSSGSSELVFLIGGAYGFGDAVRQRMNRTISLSAMTFSHQMVRVIFLEQLYRAFTILNNEPYHHE